MNMNLYSIFDTVAGVFNQPFSQINDQSAKRAFSRACLDNPDKNDYVLYALGSYQDFNGVLVPHNQPVKIMSGFEVRVNPDVPLDIPGMLKDQA